MTANPLRDLPSVDALLRTGAGEALVGEHGRQAVVAALRDVLAEARAAGEVPAQEGLLETTARRLGRPPSLRPVLNATGVIVHTNLGRAPLARLRSSGWARWRPATRRSSTTWRRGVAARGTTTSPSCCRA